MQNSPDKSRLDVEFATTPSASASVQPAQEVHCFHCGTLCRGAAFVTQKKHFCCQGCQTVFELLTENGLTDFYSLSASAGVRVKAARQDQFKFLDEGSVRQRLVNYSDARTTRVTLHIPAIHCIACVWLLENLFRLKAGIGQSQVNFPRKEVSIAFETARVQLSEVVGLITSLGYEPELKFSDLETPRKNPAARRLWLQMGMAGFAFGNIMLFSIASYLGLDSFSGPTFKKLVGYLSLFLAIPVVTYSSLEYWRSAWVSLRQKLLTIEVPIAAGIIAIFAQSSYEVLTGHGEGYFDSLCGLIFFLLCGKWFQRKTFDRLAFDRDYKSFFPLSVTRAVGETEERVALSQLAVGDRLIIRNGELIPADSCLLTGAAVVDYSFVTGESEPVEKTSGDYLYAGGRQIGGAIEVKMVKAVSQSYLTSLWNQEAFQKEKTETLHTLTNVYSYRFTKIVIAIALGSALFWLFVNPSLSLKAFTSVLIVACPCALALAAPFTLGTALRVLSRRNIFAKSPTVVETLAKVDAIVFDKTGTLTATSAGSVTFHGEKLSQDEERALFSLTRHSTHPLAVRISQRLSHHTSESVRSFLEIPGCGMEATVCGQDIWMGSAAWVRSRFVTVPDFVDQGSVVCVVIAGTYRGHFLLGSSLRPETDKLIQGLSSEYALTLLSGDNEKERDRFTEIFGANASLHFHQSPLDKFSFVRTQQRSGKTVMMVGDGLNDAGALKQSDVGVAVVENVSAFSPASDIIMSATMVPHLAEMLAFSKKAVLVVRLSFLVSSLYNIVGIAIAASGRLSPIVCAILMPISSVTVVAFASGLTTWFGRRLGAQQKQSSSATPRGATAPSAEVTV